MTARHRKLGPLSRRVLACLRSHPGITLSALSARLGVPREAVKKAVARLVRAKRIRKGRLTAHGKRLHVADGATPVPMVDATVRDMVRGGHDAKIRAVDA